jgi:PBSX family phage terminase large subunit
VSNQTIKFNWQYPKIFEPVFNYKGRYIALSGGRSSGKSWVVAHLILERLMYLRRDCLCTREHQNSIQESNYKLFVNIIRKYNLPYDVQATKIISKITGSRIVFVGLSDVTADNIKSFEDFDLVWIEEAQKISKKSWEILNPTIRKDNAQIFITMNPEIEHSKHPIMSELLTLFADETLHIHANYYDNPFCSKDIIKIAELTKIHKPDEYKHIWEGIPRDESLNNVVRGFTNENIKPITYQPNMPLHLTWDFNVDPMSCILAHKTADKVFYFDEFILENATTEQTIKEVIKAYPDHKSSIIINGDASGDNRSTQSEWSNYVIIRNALRKHYKQNNIHLHLRPSNPRIKNRIAAFNAKVCSYDGVRGLYVDPKCEKLLYNIYNLKYKVGTDIVDVPTYTQIKTDNNLKFLEHPFDAASYLVEYYFPIKVE